MSNIGKILTQITRLARYLGKEAMRDKKLTDTQSINCGLLTDEWKPKYYDTDEVVNYEGELYRCVQPHDSTVNTAWTPEAVPALWMILHGTTPDTAQHWRMPQGAHDVYKSGEFCIYEGQLYKCDEDTAYAPNVFGWVQI